MLCKEFLASLKAIEAAKNESKAYEEQKAEVDEKKNKIAKSDPVGYGKMIAKVIQQKIEEFKVEIAKLGQEIKEKLTKLQNGEINDDKKVREVEEEVSNKVSEEVSNIELNDLMTEAKKILNTVNDDIKHKLEEIKKGLWSFKISANPFQQKAYQSEKSKVEKMLSDLENHSALNSKKDTTHPTRLVVILSKMFIPVVLVVILGAVVIGALVIRKRKLVKKRRFRK